MADESTRPARDPEPGATAHSVTNVVAHSVTDVLAQTVTDVTADPRDPVRRGGTPTGATAGATTPATTAATTPAGAGGDPWLDVDMEVRLHFGGREMLLSEALAIGPGSVLELDRHVSDAVDLLVGDRIVARGEVVVLGGNFALQIAEVLPPQPRLESVRCLL